MHEGGKNMEYTDLLDGADLDQTLIGALGITVTEITPDRVVCDMAVGPKTIQPMGLLHGGASVALAETAASKIGRASCRERVEISVGAGGVAREKRIEDRVA